MGEVEGEEASQLPAPVQGKSDWRNFRCLQLKNGVTACLVHDKESKTTAAAASVKAGAASDPRSMPGLAHFCEHMCFLGSEKYPGENEYKRYLSQNGGRSNGSTSMHFTTYKFEVLAEHAEQAIDIFSNFFVSPLFTKSGTGREVNAVDSENSKNLTADVRRRLQIIKDLCDENHYFSKFTTGNAKTLPTEDEKDLVRIREALLTFHRKHYKPENLTVVVAGPQSLDELEKWIVPRFGSMEARPFPENQADMTELERLIDDSAADAPPHGFNFPQPPFRSPFRKEFQDKWPALLTVKPVRNMRRLVMMFPLPSVRSIPDRSPLSVISHLLGHEGPKSPFALLQDKGLITSLSAGTRFGEPGFSLFQLDMALTETGEAKWKDVVDVILQYCRFLHKEAVRAREQGDRSSKLFRSWEEKLALSRIFFDQTSPGSVYAFCPSLCSSIVTHGTEKCMSAGYMLNEDPSDFPLSEFEEFTSALVASNCLIERCSKGAWEEMEKETKATQKTEQWYGVDYFLSELDAEDVATWKAEAGTQPFLDASHLALPDNNRYIPRSLELCPDLPDEAKAGPRIEKEIDPPQLLINDPVLGRLWHRLDDRYALPKSILSLHISNAAAENTKMDGMWQHDPKSAAMSTLLANMFNQALAQDTYDASLAGLSWGMSLSADGIDLTCSGFSDRLNDLGLQVLKEFLKPKFITEAHYSGAKDRMLRSLKSFFESRTADAHARYYQGLLLDSSSEGIQASLTAVEGLTLNDVVEHHQNILQNEEIFVDCLMSGNVSEGDSRSFFDQATKLLMDARGGKALADPDMWIPGHTENRLAPLDDIELHFSSRNQAEENGALVMSYQSPLPGFRGKHLSSDESLRSSASLRLLCHILKEPFFDELRTKQALGYVVHSYYDGSVSLRPADLSILGPTAVPVEYVTISILSRKVSPPELKRRVDDFLSNFRKVLQSIPDSEIESHASAISTSLLKPIQKLGTEASSHLAKIRRYAPEILRTQGSGHYLPWDNSKVLAAQVRSLGRQDLLDAWDRTILPSSCSRVSSMVYGSSFPLEQSGALSDPKTITNRVSDIFGLRKLLSPFDDKPSESRKLTNYNLHQWMSKRSVAAIAAASFVSIGFIGWTLTRSKKRAF